MKCKKCKREIPEESIFCMWCGSKLIKDRSEISVPAPVRRKNGTYGGQIMVNGQRIRITEESEKAYYTKARALKESLIEIKNNPTSKTLTAAIDDFIQAREAVLSPSTIVGYKNIKKNYLQDIMKLKISSLTEQACQNAVNSDSKKFSPKTVRNAWMFIKSILQENNGQEFNVKLPGTVKNERTFLDREQSKEFCKAIAGSAAEVPALLAMHSLRKSELLALTWDSIDLDKRLIHVSGAVVQGPEGKVKKAQNKNEGSSRTVPIMMDQLYNALKSRNAAGLPLFDVGEKKIHTEIKNACRKANLPAVTLHGLRHTFATTAAVAGVPEHITRSIGGWSDSGTMKKVYTHAAEADKEYFQNELAAFWNE